MGCYDTGNRIEISGDSCNRSQNQGIPDQPGAIRIEKLALTDFQDHSVKGNRGRVRVSYETLSISVQSINLCAGISKDLRAVVFEMKMRTCQNIEEILAPV